MKTGSLRGVILMWIRMTMGVGILTLPCYFKTYGANTGLIILLIAAIINYYTYIFILEASYYTGKSDFSDLIETLLGQKILRIFKITYMLDISSAILLYAIVSWNLFEYCLWFFKLTRPGWIKNEERV